MSRNTRRTDEAEIVYDRYAYERLVDSYQSAARKALEGGGTDGVA